MIRFRPFTAAAAAAAAMICAASPASAWPLVGAAQKIGELRCYPDDADPALWWYVPDRLELAPVDGRPGFSFDRYRYTGTALTGDQGEFWGRGVLTFRVRFAPSPAELAHARSEIERRTRRGVVLKPVPLVRVESNLVYAGAGDSGVAGDLRGGAWSGDGEIWTERSYEIGLSPASADALWQLYHREGLAVSLGYSLVGQGVLVRGDAAGEEEVEPETVTFAGDAIPIRVSPEACPECFQSVELDARIAAEYPFLEVYCYDFESGRAPTDLALAVVEVRATAVTGDRPREEVRFARGGRFKAAVDFEFAVRLDRGYEYRVVRVFEDGRQQTDGWQTVDGWTGILDVTAYRHDEEDELDPRSLY
jgi:hypothetical protein